MPLLSLLLQVLVVALTVLTCRSPQGKLLEGEGREWSVGRERVRRERSVGRRKEQHTQDIRKCTVLHKLKSTVYMSLFTQLVPTRTAVLYMLGLHQFSAIMRQIRLNCFHCTLGSMYLAHTPMRCITNISPSPHTHLYDSS